MTIIIKKFLKININYFNPFSMINHFYSIETLNFINLSQKLFHFQ